MIDSKNPNDPISLAFDDACERVDNALWELYSDLAEQDFDLLHAIEDWLLDAYGYCVIRRDRFDRVVRAERKIREAKPIVTALAEMLQTEQPRVRVGSPQQEAADNETQQE
jgi:hypothetical protein